MARLTQACAAMTAEDLALIESAWRAHASRCTHCALVDLKQSRTLGFTCFEGALLAKDVLNARAARPAPAAI